MENNIELNKYEEYYTVLQDSLKKVQSKDASLDEVIKALENGVNAHAKLEEIIKQAEEKIQEIIDNRGV